MKRILGYKLYEGVYNDIISEINKKKLEISRLKENYKSEMDNCMVDITDNWNVVYSGFPRDTENDTDYGEFEITYEIEVSINDVDNFLDKFNDVYELIKSYMGLIIKIEAMWCQEMDSYNQFDNIGREFNNEKDLNKKKDIINNFLSKSLSGKNKNSLLSICLVIEP